jgi:exonuclease SbcD
VFRVLCTGDVHIGRRVTRTPEVYRTSGAWTALVDLAIAQQVDLLAISGDLIDKEGKSYEAFGPVEAGLYRLAEAGIPTVAVSGNHDFDILHRLANISASTMFRMLGRNGTWERATYANASGDRLHVDGWSFGAEHVIEQPLLSYPAAPADGAPVMGLLHGDVGVVSSRYAPVLLSDLWSAPVDFWLLGHIHAPAEFSASDGRRRALYPGSPWAMDPGETGGHGAWVAEFEGGALTSLQKVMLSPVLFTSSSVDVSTIESSADLFEAIMLAMQGIGLAAVEQHGTNLRVVSCRLQLTGRTSRRDQIEQWKIQAEQNIEPVPMSGGVLIHLDRLSLMAQPAIDLDELAVGTDPVGELARLIQSLHEPGLAASRVEPVLMAAGSRLQSVWRTRDTPHCGRELKSLPVPM